MSFSSVFPKNKQQLVYHAHGKFAIVSFGNIFWLYEKIFSDIL